MIRGNGLLIGARYCSNIYFIIHNGYLYIGETGGHPSIRWGSHLSKGGTLRENLRKYEGDDIDEKKDIFFASIAADIIDTEEEEQRKIARKALEYEVRRRFLLESYIFGEELIIVSTANTCPLRHQFSFDPESFAGSVLSMAVKQYEKWKKIQNTEELFK